MTYTLQLIDRKNISLKEEEGLVLKEALVSGRVPKYIEIGNDLINSSQIMGIFADEEPEPNKLLPPPNLTKEQLENREKYLSLLRSRWGNGVVDK